MNRLKKLAQIYWGLTAFIAFLWVALLASLVSFAVGCADLPTEERQGLYDYVSNTVERVIAVVEEERDAKAQQDQTSSSDAAANPPAADTTADGGQSAGSAAPEPLVFKFGGFDGSKAVEDQNAQIKDLHMSKSGLSHKWAKGGCETLGSTSRTDCDHTLACAFYWDGKQWIGGKFDWTSTSRTTRDFKNLNGGYKGWKPDLFWAASRRAFCIVSEDGKRRTNLIETKEP